MACATLGVATHGVEFALGVGAYEGRAAFKDLRITDAAGKVVYSNDFATPDAVKDWLPAGRGVWKCGGGTLEQTFGGLGHEAVTLSIPQKFRNVTLTVKAKKIDGKEGFIVSTDDGEFRVNVFTSCLRANISNNHTVEKDGRLMAVIGGSPNILFDTCGRCRNDVILSYDDDYLVLYAVLETFILTLNGKYLR
jgi:hypothetical protein